MLKDGTVCFYVATAFRDMIITHLFDFNHEHRHHIPTIIQIIRTRPTPIPTPMTFLFLLANGCVKSCLSAAYINYQMLAKVLIKQSRSKIGIVTLSCSIKRLN